MDIYSIGEEKCIDGVWGRELAGRFYTHVHSNRGICRHLSVNQNEFKYEYYAVLTDKTTFCEQVYTQGTLALKQYIPQHSKDLENLKRGDIVWVKQPTKLLGEVWSPVVYLSMNTSCAGFICNEVFDGKGTGLGATMRVYKEVFLKPPFEL